MRITKVLILTCLLVTNLLAQTVATPIRGTGTAGTPATGVVSIQGVASGTAVPISAASLPLPTLAATSTKQSDGSQKTQIVDGSGNVIGSTSNALDINIKSGNPTTIAVTNTGTFAVQESGGALTSLQLIDDTVGTVASAIPTKGLAALGTDGTNGRILKTDSSGELQVDVLTLPNVTIGTFPDNEPFNMAQIGGVTPSVGNGTSDTGTLRVTVASNSTGTIIATQGTATSLKAEVIGAGTAGSANSGVLTVQGIASMTPVLVAGASASGAAKSGNPVQTGGVFNTTPPTVTTGQTVEAQYTNRGEAHHVIRDAAGNLRGANVDSNNNLGVVLAAETTKVLGTVRVLGNAGAIVDGAIGAAPPANVLYMGGLTSGATGGLLTGIVVCDSFANVQQTGNAQVISGVSGRRVYICALNLVTATAQNVAVVAGTGSVCATNTVAVPGTSGGATAATGWNFAANGGIVLGTGLGAVGKTTVNADNVCVFQSGSGQLSGGITYAII